MAARRRNRVRPLATALSRALRSVTTTPADDAAVELAQQYADAIDEAASTLPTLGPRLLETLAELGMTPKARATLARGASGGSAGNSKLDELRARRERRAAAVDAPAAASDA